MNLDKVNNASRQHIGGLAFHILSNLQDESAEDQVTALAVLLVIFTNITGIHLSHVLDAAGRLVNDVDEEGARSIELQGAQLYWKKEKFS